MATRRLVTAAGVVATAAAASSMKPLHAERNSGAGPFWKGAGLDVHVGQVGQHVKQTSQGDGGTHIEGDVGHPQALDTLHSVTQNTNEYGLAAMKEFASAQKAAAAAAAAAAEAAANAQMQTAKTHKEEVQWASGALAAAGAVVSVSGVVIIFMLKSMAESFIAATTAAKK